MRKRGKKLLAMMLALSMTMNVVSFQAFADEPVVEVETLDPVDNGDGTATDTTITTTTTTNPETGNVTVNVEIKKELTDTNEEDGIDVSGGSTRVENTTTDENGKLVEKDWKEDGTEKKEWTEEDSGNDPGQKEVKVEVELKKDGSATDYAKTEDKTGNINSPEGQTTITTTDRTVTTTTSKVEVKVEDSNTGLVEEQETALKGLDPVYDENDNLHINPSNGQPLDKVNGEHVGKKDVFDRNYLSADSSYTDTSKWDMPEEADFRYVGTGEHSKFYNARVSVVYKKDADGNTVYDAYGNPIIDKITKKDGTIITIDGVPATELPEEVSLVPVFDDYNGGRPTTFMLMDKNGNKVYAYCCDMETSAKKGSWYSVSNLEDSDYYGSEESEEHIRSIVMNGYWGTSDIPDADGNYQTGSLESIKAGLREAINSGKMENTTVQMPAVDADGKAILDNNGNPVMETKSMLELIDELTEGEALLATQSAIWAYANGHVDALNGKDGVVVIDPDGYKWNQNPTSDSKDGEALNDYGSARVDFLYNWLINLETEEESTVIINDKNFVEDMSLVVGDKIEDTEVDAEGKDHDIYNVDLNFKLAFVPGENDDLLVQISYTDLDGNPVNVIRRLAGENAEGQSYENIMPEEDGSYVLKGLKLSENDDFDFDLRLEGTQYLEQGVYVYAPVGGRDVSQTFVGIAEGERNVDVSFGVTVSFDVDENNHVVAERKWHDEGSNRPRPTGGNDDDDDNGGGGSTTTTTINDPNVPLAAADTIEINENDIPLSDGVLNIEDAPIPLAVLPMTGDVSVIWMLISLISGLGLAGVSLADWKKRR